MLYPTMASGRRSWGKSSREDVSVDTTVDRRTAASTSTGEVAKNEHGGGEDNSPS
jgi:hypothetical protein